jgi:hypothetical protein
MPDKTPQEGTWESMLWQAVGADQVNREEFLEPAWISYGKESPTTSRHTDNAAMDGTDNSFTIYRKADGGRYQVIEASLNWFASGADAIYNDRFIANFRKAITNHRSVLDPDTLRSAATSFSNADTWLQYANTTLLKPTIDDLGGEHPDFAGNAAGAFHHWIYNLYFEFEDLRNQIVTPSWTMWLNASASYADEFINNMKGHWSYFDTYGPHPKDLLQRVLDDIKTQVADWDRVLSWGSYIPGGTNPSHGGSTGGDSRPAVGVTDTWYFYIDLPGRARKFYDLAKQTEWVQLNSDIQDVWRKNAEAELDGKLKPYFDTMTNSFSLTQIHMADPIKIRPYPVPDPFSNGPDGANGGNSSNLPNIPMPDAADLGGGSGGGGGAGMSLPDLGGSGSGGGGGAGSNLPDLGGAGGGAGFGGGLPFLPGIGGTGGGRPTRGGGAGGNLPDLGGGLGAGGVDDPHSPGGAGFDGPSQVGSGVPGLNLPGGSAGSSGLGGAGATIPGLGDPAGAGIAPGLGSDESWSSPAESAFPTGSAGASGGQVPTHPAAGWPVGAGADFGAHGGTVGALAATAGAGVAGVAGAAGTAGTAAGTPMGGMPFMPMGGMGGGQSNQDKERERTTWLAEEEEVWGTDPDVAPAVVGRDALPDLDPAEPTWQPAAPQQAPTPGRRRVATGRGDR